MNIIEMEDMVKGLPDQVLFQEAQMPSGRIPQFLALSEVQRRQDMRQRFSARQEQQGTVKDQILQGIGGISPPQMGPEMAPPMAPQMGPQMAPPMQPPVQGMAAGGVVKMADGGITREEFDKLTKEQQERLLQIENDRRNINATGHGASYLFSGIPDAIVGTYNLSSAITEGIVNNLGIPRLLRATGLADPEFEGLSIKRQPLYADEALSGIVANKNFSDIREYRDSLPSKTSSSGSREPTVLPGTYTPPSALLGAPITFDRAPSAPQAPPTPAAASGAGIASVGSVPNLADSLMPEDKYLEMMELDKEALEEAYAPVDYGDIIGRLGETAKRYSTESEESIGKMREQAKKDAFAYALMQMGAGLAGGDMARGLERGAEAAFGVLDKSKQREMDERRAARAEARALEAQGLQLEITGRGLDAQAKRDLFNATRQAQVDMANAFRQFGMDKMEARYRAASLAQTAAATAATLQREGRLDKRAAVDLFQTILTNAMKDPPLEATTNQASMDAYRQKIYGEAAKIVQRSFPEFDFRDLVEATNEFGKVDPLGLR